MKIKAHAKINLGLQIINKRDDGYHELDMVMAPIELHDLLYIDVIDEGIVIESNSNIVPTDERNIVYKVSKMMFEKFNIKKGLKINIFKHIPSQAGLAGGSADGAAVIKAINKLFKLNLSKKEMADLGKEIGADIPFCIYEELSRVQGIGDNVFDLNNKLDFSILLVKPRKGVSTKKAFSKVLIDKGSKNHIDQIEKSIVEGDYDLFINGLYNDLEKPACEIVPAISEIKHELLTMGFDGCLMSGSGSTVFGITRNSDVLNAGVRYFKNTNYFVRKTTLLK